MTHADTKLSRRSLLAGATGLAALGGVGGLSACSGSEKRSTNDAAANNAVILPTYRPYDGAKADLAATTDGVEAGFYNYPAKRPQSVAEKPGTGAETVTAMANIYVAVPPGVNDNSYWAELNKRLGVDLQMRMVPNADYSQKFATTIAGSSIPDMMQMQTVANFPQLLDKRFTPLDEHLSGDAVMDYPNLANLPEFTWRGAVYNGHLYGVPIPRGRVATYDFVRADIFEKLGLPIEIDGGLDGLLSVSKEATDPRQRRWAFSMADQARGVLVRMNEVPNGWRAQDGTLVNAFETDEFGQTVDDLTTFWNAGVLHPDAFNQQQPFKALFEAGTAVFDANDGYLAWAGFVSSNKDRKSFKQDILRVQTRDGSKPAPHSAGQGFYAINAFAKQDDPEKIKLALRVCNYLAAPFGTEEHLFGLYGEEGVDHTVDADGNPKLTDQGVANTSIPVHYMGDCPRALYQPGRPQDVDLQHAYQSDVLPTAVLNPTWGHYSNAMASKNASAEKAFNETVNAIVQGRKKRSELDTAVKEWRSTAGDAMREDFLKQL